MTLRAKYLSLVFVGLNIIPQYAPPDPSELFYLRINEVGFPLPYKVVDFDPSRLSNVCVRTDVYPLLWVWYIFLKWLDRLNLWAMVVVYRLLKKANNNNHFIHPSERIDGWGRMIHKYFERAKK